MAGRFKKKKLRMWHKNPHCERCGVLTILPDDVPNEKRTDVRGNTYEVLKEQPDNMATIQHIYCRNHPIRNTPRYKYVKRYFLWCYKCNQEYHETFERINYNKK